MDLPYTIEHFSLANPAGDGQESVCALLRRMADTIQALGPVNVQDLVFHAELDDDGREWPTMTVYLHRQ